MSYEKFGMGWSDIAIDNGWPWPFNEKTYPTCSQAGSSANPGIKRCFTDDPADVRCAEYSGCVNISEGCQTVRGGQGTTFCCPYDKPPPPPEECIPPGTSTSVTVATQGMTCNFSHVQFNTLRDARSRSIWTVQNKLCMLGIDPGPVDGTENDSRYRDAIRRFQSRNSLSVTGQPDAVTLYRMGLDNAEVLANAIAGSGAGNGLSLNMPNMLPYLMLGGFSLSSIFLVFALRKYKRSKR